MFTIQKIGRYFIGVGMYVYLYFNSNSFEQIRLVPNFDL